MVSFALPNIVGNNNLGRFLKELNVSHVHYYNEKDYIVVMSHPHYQYIERWIKSSFDREDQRLIMSSFDREMNQVARPLLMDYSALSNKLPKTISSLVRKVVLSYVQKHVMNKMKPKLFRSLFYIREEQNIGWTSSSSTWHRQRRTLEDHHS